MYKDGSGFLEKQGKRGYSCLKWWEGQSRACGCQRGDTGCFLLLKRDEHHSSSSCLLLPKSRQAPALWFSQALWFKWEYVLAAFPAGDWKCWKKACCLASALCLTSGMSEQPQFLPLLTAAKCLKAHKNDSFYLCSHPDCPVSWQSAAEAP